MDEPDLLSAEHLYLLLASAIGPVMLRWLQNLQSFLEPVTMAATAGLRPAMDKEALAPRNTVGWDEICNFHAAPLTWSKARRDLKYEEGMALGVGLIRLLLWHLLQPAVYFYLIHVYRRQLSNAIFGLAVVVVVGVREGLYMVFTLIALVVNPAFLLINLNTDDDFHKRVAMKATYVFAPEFYVFQLSSPCKPMCKWLLSHGFLLHGCRRHLRARGTVHRAVASPLPRPARRLLRSLDSRRIGKNCRRQYSRIYNITYEVKNPK
jgi:hypothetical protein